MKKLFKLSLSILLVFGLIFNCFAAWDKTRPTDDELKKDVPAVVRANWQAIETGTDTALQVTNAKVAATAAIVDTKLSQITTPAKVSGAAVTLLPNVPAGAGALPIANGGTAATTAANARSNLGVVGVAGDETIAGVKTLSSIPVLPASDPTTDNQASRKAYTDTKISKTTVGEINAMTEKTSLADNDVFLIEDSAASYAKKKVKKSNVSAVNKQLFTSSGTFTAPAGITTVILTMAGSGGGGNGGGTGYRGGGGGAGAEIQTRLYTVVPGNNYTVTINAAGTGCAGAGYGYETTSACNAGGTTVFDSLIASGGAGGAASNTPPTVIVGGAITIYYGSVGGTAGATGNPGTPGGNGSGYGAGGGGGGNNGNNGPAGAGGNGAAGFVFVEW